jgi:hypothetical protein
VSLKGAELVTGSTEETPEVTGGGAPITLGAALETCGRRVDAAAVVLDFAGAVPITLGALLELAAVGPVPTTLGALVELEAFGRPPPGAFAKPARRLPADDCTFDDIDTTEPPFLFAFGLALG